MGTLARAEPCPPGCSSCLRGRAHDTTLIRRRDKYFIFPVSKCAYALSSPSVHRQREGGSFRRHGGHLQVGADHGFSPLRRDTGTVSLWPRSHQWGHDTHPRPCLSCPGLDSPPLPQALGALSGRWCPRPLRATGVLTVRAAGTEPLLCAAGVVGRHRQATTLLSLPQG